ncbi:MAG TPA: ATP-binding protein [Bacteroidales bacterium]|nr:ATP-binding protein [Bacteroidales bacterium]
MSKRWTLVWLTVVFSLFLVLAIFAFHKDNPILLISSEFVIPVLYGITIWMMIRSLKPISSIGRSLNLLKEGEFNITLVKTGNSDVDNIIEVYNSMINRLREERLSVREKNHFLDLLIESSPLGIVMMDLDDKIIEINKAAARSLGINGDCYKGKALTELNSNLSNELAKISFEEKQLVILADGQKFLCRKLFFMDHGFKHPFYIIEEFTEEIKKAEKEAYGKLIRMMAHEVNNTVGAVNSIMTSIQSNPETFVNSDLDDSIRMLGVAIQRNYQMNRFMQNFSNVVKLPAPDKEKMDLNESLSLVIESYNAELKEKNIYVEMDLDITIPLINADRSQMEQVFLNIIKNAKEAVPVNGHLKIITQKNPVAVIFRDDGPGLSREVSEKLFTPFFSTKPGGQGIGLTLGQEILTNHGFSFSFRNTETIGAEFKIICQNNK